MKTRRLALLISLICFSSLNVVWAVPARPDWQDMVQPDGSVIELRLVGDEFYHFWQNSDGQEVIQNADGYWVVKSQQLTPAQRRARRAASPMLKEVEEMRKAPVIPTPTRMLVILVNFSDKSLVSSHNSTFFGNMLNQEGYSTYGSVRDYFIAASDGQYQPTFDVFGPVTLDSAMAYYGGNDEDGDDLHPREMAWEACKKADAMGCNFALYDANNDGTVDNVYIIYAGYAESSCSSSWPQAVWPHSWNMSSASGNTKLDGKLLRKYGCSAELDGCSGTSVDGIGTFCHEFSHVIGMPDYYDTKYGENHTYGRTPGEWSLMDQGSYNGGGHRPPLYSIFDKCYMQWASMPPVLAKDANLTIEMPVGAQYARHITGTTSAKSYTSTDTIYYLENRQKSGNFDGALPGSGLVIWKVVYTSSWSSPNNTAGFLRYTVVSATGSTDNIGKASDPFPGSSKVTSKTLWPGCALTGITSSNSIITFNYNGGSTIYNHTWMANGAQFTTTTSRSSLSLPTTSPSACSSTKQFYGWTKQTAIQQDGSDLVLAQAYDEITANTTFYAVYKTTSSPARYSFQCSDQTYTTYANAKAVIVQGQDIEIGGQIVSTPGVYPYDTIKTIQGDSVLAVNLTWADLNKTIVYRGTKKLDETTASGTAGLHTNAFGQTIMEHHFSNGIGVIAFDNNLTTVGTRAFFGCRNGNNSNKLTAVQLPNTVTSIGENAFSNCWEITSIDLPSGLKNIGYCAFYKCQSMQNFVLPDGVDTIADNAFQNCTKLQHITLSEGLKLIGHTVFSGCSTLVDITSRSLKPAASYSTTFSGITPANIVLKVWPSKVTTYSSNKYWGAFTTIQTISCGTTATITPQSHAICQGDTYIWRKKQLAEAGVYRDTTYTDAYGCDSVIYQLTLTVHPTYHFKQAAILETDSTYTWRSQTLTQKGIYHDSLIASTGCDSVYTLYLTDSACAIIYTAPRQLIETDSSAINTGGVHVDAFGQKLLAHTFENGVGMLVFADTLTQIGYRAFYGCQQGNNSALTSIIIPSSITTIGAQAFYADFQLATSLVLPQGLTSIGHHAFHRCPLTSVTCQALVPPTCGELAFNQVDKTIPLYVWPIGYKAYQTADQWSDFTNLRKLCDDPATIHLTTDTICQGDSLWWKGQYYKQTIIQADTTMNPYGCDTVIDRLELTVGANYFIEEKAAIVQGMTYPWHNQQLTATGIYYDSLLTPFGCDSIYMLTLTVVNANQAIVYQSDKKLVEITSPAQSSSLGLHTYTFGQPMLAHTFFNGTGIIAFANDLTQVGDSAFYGCRDTYGQMTSISLPTTITQLGNAAFYFCKHLTSLHLPEGVTSIGNRGIYRCESLTSLTCEALTPPACGTESFIKTPTTAVLYVWPISQKPYQKDASWSYFTDIRRIACDEPLREELTQDTIYDGDSLLWRGQYYKYEGAYVDTSMNRYGCDTVIYQLELTVDYNRPTPVDSNPSTPNDDPTRKLIFHDRLLIFRNGRYYDTLGHPLP